MNRKLASIMSWLAWAHGIVTMAHGFHTGNASLVLFGLAACCGSRFARMYADGELVLAERRESDGASEGDSGG